MLTPDGLVPESPAVPTVVAHRGASGQAPENTLAAVRRAVELRVDRVEVDVQRTKDGVPVVIHDTTLARTTDVRRVYPRRAPWLVGDFTLAEIQRLDAGGWYSPAFAGERVPTLEEVLQVLDPSGTGLLLEIKSPALHPGLAVDVASVLTSRGIARGAGAPVTVQSFDHAVVRWHKQLVPDVPVGALGAPLTADLGRLATWADEVNPVHWSVTDRFVEAAHRHGMRCHPWTVNRPVHMRRVLGLGVDGVITDRPGVLRKVLADGDAQRPNIA